MRNLVFLFLLSACSLISNDPITVPHRIEVTNCNACVLYQDGEPLVQGIGSSGFRYTFDVEIGYTKEAQLLVGIFQSPDATIKLSVLDSVITSGLYPMSRGELVTFKLQGYNSYYYSE